MSIRNPGLQRAGNRQDRVWKLALCNRKTTDPGSNQVEFKDQHLSFSPEYTHLGTLHTHIERERRVAYIKVSSICLCKKSS